MDANQVVTNAKDKFAQAVGRFQDSLKTLRTGRANAAMLDGVKVEAYGTPMPLNQVATISVPDATLIQLSPFDPNNLGAIAEAIRNDSSLGLNPTDDGRVIRVPIPPLTEERRRELAKQVGAKQEECMIVLRNVRHEAMDTLNQAKKDKDIGEDEAKRLGGQVDEAMNKARGEAETAAKTKESEILSL
ncbi:MAG TPA: ribosome recycling factor [Candidatus Saccharimonadales bacterium]|nr:ribosome recycling factor [Candidatus Saccharimonadales bacterium]